MLVQAAFKRPVAGSGPDVTAVDSSMDWDAVKPEDRTLIEQVSLCMLLLVPLFTVPLAHLLLTLSVLPVLAEVPTL